MKLSIDYQLTGTGWAECRIVDEVMSCTISASYLSDSLRLLVLGATASLSGFRRLTFSFEEEPGEYRWVVTSPRPNIIEILILEFADIYSEQPDMEGNVLFQTQCEPIVFASAVHEAAKKVLMTYGESGYAKQWVEHPFPMQQFSELSRLLKLEQGNA